MDSASATNSVGPTEQVLLVGMAAAAARWVEAAKFQRAEEGLYLPLDVLTNRFLDTLVSGASPHRARCWKAAGRAIVNSIEVHLGHTPPCMTLKAAGKNVEGKAFGVSGPGLEEHLVRPLEVATREAAREQRKRAQEAARDSVQHRVLENTPSLKGGCSSRYTTELLSLACAPRLLELKLYPDAKELTESFAAFAAVRDSLREAFAMDDPSVTVVCVGDGVVPRTAALFAFRTRWQCISVDPLMRETSPDGRWKDIGRLKAYRRKIEDMEKIEAPRILLVCVHAHVGVEACMEAISWSEALGVVAMPCCNFYGRLCLPEAPVATYEDPGVVSPHRLVRVYLKQRQGMESMR